jgi:polysaccharide export outer membrane protein
MIVFTLSLRVPRECCLLHVTVGKPSTMPLALFPVVGVLFFLLLSGCSATATLPAHSSNAGEVDSASVHRLSRAPENNDLVRLSRLWEQRKRETLTSDYPIGPGDVLEITVAAVDEIQNLSQRVTAEETISLPFIGVINTRGLTDKTLRAEIRRRLQTNYVRDPQVSLFVKEFRSRQVAVIGAVQKPGLYNLASPADTILSMISQAGGTTASAAERILFIPAEPAEPDKAKEILSAMPVQMLNSDPSPRILKDAEPLVISLDGVNKSGQEKYLSMPARPGDIVMIPGAGEVLVQGWVAKPGAYKITPGLTLLGLVAAAGGMKFPADAAAVELIRTNSAGHKSKLLADLDAIKSGANPDLPLREGDVVEVVSSSPKLLAYGFYRFFTSLVHIGASATVPIR